jgi:hypothetical protein
MNPGKRENFDDLPILAELGSLLERHFFEAERRARQIVDGPRPNEPMGPSSVTTRRRVGRRGLPRTAAGAPVVLSIIVVVVVAAVALTLVKRAGTPPGRQPPGSIGAFPQFPNLSSSEAKYVIDVRRATIARDPACSPFASGLPMTVAGSPGSALTSILGILRRPATAGDDPRERLFQNRIHNDPDSAGREVYTADIRLARSVAGVRFYIVPTGSASGLKPVPARCDAEQTATLKRELAGTSNASRTRILAAQRQYLAWERYGELHPEGIADAELRPRADGTSVSRGCCSTVADIENGIAGLGFMSADGSLFLHGVVPDGVATVTLRRTASPGYTATGTVVNNVWVIRLPVENVAGAFPLQYIWRSPQGAVIKTIG